MSDRKIYQVREGKTKPAMSRLKGLPETVQTQVLGILEACTYKDAEPMVETLVGFFCSSNILCRFRQWHEAREAMSLGDERGRQIKEFLQKEMPDASPEKLRELGVMFCTLVSLGNGDAKEFVTVSHMQVQSEREQIRARKLDLEERKFQEALRLKLDAGLDALAKMFQENPEAMNHFEKARELVTNETCKA
jgi:hypothetical protein